MNQLRALLKCLVLGILGVLTQAHAANYVFPGTLPAGCSGSGPNYTCGALTLVYNDTIVINSPKPATITINGNFETNNAVINNAGTAADLNIVVSGTLSTGDNVVIGANVQAATVNNNTNAAQFRGNVTATSGNVVLGYQTTVTGTVTSASGSITMGNEAVITGDVTSTGGGAVTVKYKSRITGSVTTTGAVTLENETRVGGSVNGGTGAIQVNYKAQVTGSVISSTGTILMDNETVAGTCVKSTGSAAITLNYHANVAGVCCGSSCNNTCVTNNSSYTMPALCAPTQSCIVDNFASGTLDTSLWNAIKLAGPFTPAVVTVNGQKRLRLTDVNGNESTMVQLKKWFPAAGNKVIVQFDHYVYGGNGADGVVVVLSDASVAPAPGGVGGSLGYAQNGGAAGFAGGWLGVGIDEYGNFPNTNESRVGYPSGWTAPAPANVGAGFYANSVVVRGSGSGTTGYRLLANTGSLSPQIWSNSNTSSTSHRYRITLDNSNNINAYVTVERDTSGSGTSFATLVPKFDVMAANSQQTAVPANMLLSLTGGTGGSNNIHEMANLSICATYMTDPAGSSNASGFDCLETGTSTTWSTTASATTRPLYTKLTSTNFTFDVAALKADGSLESNYVAAGGNTKYVQVDLFDNLTPAANCSAYSNPVATLTVPFLSGSYSGAAGRAVTGNFNVATARAKLICRVRECTSSACSAYTSVSPACSTDQFSVRPQQLTVTAAAQTNTAITGNPKDLAGNNFTLNASSGVASGYTGTPMIDTSKVIDHNDAAIATGTLSGSFSAATGVQATGAAFKYLDVGTIRFQADAVVDSTFTTIDQTNSHCIAGSTSNTLSGGKYGCNIGSAQSSRMGRWVPSHFSFAGTLTPFCAAGNFTYMNQDSLGVVLTLKAHAKSAATAAASDPVVSRYTTGYTNLAPVTLSGDNLGGVVALTRLTSPTFPIMPNTSLWSAGVFAVSDTYAFSKLANADGPYDSFKIKAAINDPDGGGLIGGTNETGTTRIRYGRLRMQNAYGSELLALPVPFEAQYWNGNFYVTNTDDSCTSLTMSSIEMGNFTGGLAACETQITPVTPTVTQTLANGRIPGGLVLTRPGAGNSGSVDLAMNVTNAAVAGAITCVGPASSAATAANRPWFGPNIGGRATFGIYRSPLIYLRENY